MIINSKTVSLTEAATRLGMTEQKVLQLSHHGYLEQAKPENGKTRIIVGSLEKFASRSGIARQEAPKPVVVRSENFTIGETMTKLGLHTESYGMSWGARSKSVYETCNIRFLRVLTRTLPKYLNNTRKKCKRNYKSYSHLHIKIPRSIKPFSQVQKVLSIIDGGVSKFDPP
ncbi:hypothetical protein FHS15_000107 [Paenibacillus castaneae]|uniref:hypothetical protein n=1 Tax=Paenibacillus castaneae TaxID=474957 RepID=UPI000C99CE95|nr:hypothetical protein [Paenibacillus castaneae]NIK75009.1 hypothetical protein [Paenibacillus castaneae]